MRWLRAIPGQRSTATTQAWIASGTPTTNITHSGQK